MIYKVIFEFDDGALFKAGQPFYTRVYTSNVSDAGKGLAIHFVANFKLKKSNNLAGAYKSAAGIEFSCTMLIELQETAK